MRRFSRRQFGFAPNATRRARNRMIVHGNRCRTRFATANSSSENGCAAIEFSITTLGSRWRNVICSSSTTSDVMLCEAKANGHEVPIDIAPFSSNNDWTTASRSTIRDSGSATATWDGPICTVGRRDTAAFLPGGSMNWTPSRSAFSLPRRTAGSTVSIFGTRAPRRV